MSGTNTQRVGVREAAAAATRERILDAAWELFSTRWYDEVTVRQIAASAGVAVQTVVNHFATKEAVFAELVNRLASAGTFIAHRDRVAPGDLRAAAAAVVADYEAYGDPTVRMLALEERSAALREAAAIGRAAHRAWCERTFPAALAGRRGAAHERRLDLLVVATDVFTWKLLRRDHGRSRAQTVAAVLELLEALHHPPTPPHEEDPS